MADTVSRLVRTDSNDPDFQALVVLLDQELKVRDGAEHAFFAQFNKIDSIRNVVVAFVEDKAVGCGAFKPYDDQLVEIKRMFVHPNFRGRRIAQSILSALEAWSRELGSAGFILETGWKQPEAVRLYQRCGYQVIPNYGQYAGVTSSVCFRKDAGTI